MKLYAERSTVESYEVTASETDIWAALLAQDIKPDFPGETLAEVFARTNGTYPYELVLAALVGDASPEDHSETWALDDWDDSDGE